MTYTDLIKFYGTQAVAAKAIGLTQPSVCEWKTSSVPFLRQHQFEIVSRGKLKAHIADDLRAGALTTKSGGKEKHHVPR